MIIIQIIQVIYSIYIMFLKNKRNMLINMFISNLISLILFNIAGLGEASLTTIFITLFSLLPCVTAIISVITLWFGNEQQIRIGSIISNLIWVIYYYLNNIYISATFNLIVIIFTIISCILNNRIYKKSPKLENI